MKKYIPLLVLYLICNIALAQAINTGKDSNISEFSKSTETDIGICMIKSPAADYCGFDLFKPEVWYKNYGTETITSFTASYRLDFYPITSVNITQTIQAGDSLLVIFDEMTISAGNHSVQFSGTSPNGTLDSDPTNNNRSKTFNFSNGKEISITILTDNYGTETSWNLKDANNLTIASGNGMQSNTLYTTYLCLSVGCYTFTIFDSFGDGICAGYGNGYYLVKNEEDNTEIGTGCNFTQSLSIPFCIETLPGLPIANLMHTAVNNCTGDVNFFDNSLCNPAATAWLWNFGDGATSNLQNPQHNYTTNGYYTVSLEVTNINGTSEITVPNSVSIQKELPPFIADEHFCFGEDVNFSSPEDEILEWFTHSNDMLPSQTNPNISFTALENDTTIFYQYFDQPDYHNLGIVDNSGVGGFFNFAIDRAIYFDAIADVTITNATVYASGAASRTITLKNSVGTVLDTRVLEIPDGQSTIYLNFEITAGENYAIHLNNGNNLSFTGDYGGPDVGYPFTVPGLISITGNNYSNSFWYFLYNIEVQEGIGDGCYSSREPLHAIMSPQTINLGNDTLICNGNNIILNPSGYEEYLWDSGSIEPTLLITESGTYNITVADQYSCTATGEIIIEIADELFYNIEITHPSSIGTNDGSINIDIISGSSPYNIIWSNSLTEFTITDLSPGVYTYTIFDGFECEHMGQIEIYSSVNTCENNASNFEIYPNPASGNVSIIADSELEIIKIINFNGQEVITQKIKGNSVKLDISKLPNGIYYIYAEGEKASYRKKLIISQ